jgi:hypothetical protein
LPRVPLRETELKDDYTEGTSTTELAPQDEVVSN